MEFVTRQGFICLLSPLYRRQWFWDERLDTMAAWRRAIELSLEDADLEKLKSIAQSRTEPASRVERARILLTYLGAHLQGDPSLACRSAIRPLRVHLPTQACLLAEPRRGFLFKARPTAFSGAIDAASPQPYQPSSTVSRYRHMTS
jgi:hypothetical protein